MGPSALGGIAPFVALAVAVVFAIFFAILAGSKTRTNQSNADTPLLGKAAPTIVGDTLDGGNVRPLPPAGELGRPELLPVELRAVQGRAP